MIQIGEHWQIRPISGDCGEISLRDDLSIGGRLYVLWIKKTKLVKLYRLIHTWLATSEGIIFNDVMFHGNFKASKAVRTKVDTVFQLKNGWTIRPDSLKALTRGPLLSEDGTEILVPAHGRFTSFALWIDGSPVLKFIGAILMLVGLAQLVLGLF